MLKWEYLRICTLFRGTEKGSRLVVAMVNEQPLKEALQADTYIASLGEQGWELVSISGEEGIHNGWWIFKRPKPDMRAPGASIAFSASEERY